MAAQQGSGLISRAVREALGTLVSPQLCEQVIARSLAAQGLDEIPESGTALGGWLEGALRVEVETAVGADAADLLVAQLGPIAAYAAITKPRTPAPARSDAQPGGKKLKNSAKNLAAAVEAMAAERPESAPPEPEHLSSQTLRSEPPVAVQAHARDAARASQRAAAQTQPNTPTPVVGPRGASERSRDYGGPTPSNRPTELRFDLSSGPDYSIAATPAPASSNPFGSEPPTGSFTRPAPAGVMTLPAPAGQHGAEGGVRTLPPPVQPVREPRARSNRAQRRTAMPERNAVEGRTLPVVLTATSHLDDLAALRRYLAGTATVVHVPDFVGLLDAIDEPSIVEPIVLIDCQRPTVHITSVAAIGEDFPRGTTVVLWGADEVTWQQLDRDRMPSCRWVRCSVEATPHDVGSLCSMLLG